MDFDWTMVIAMIAMRMMKVAINQIVYMVTMGNRFMAATRAMHMFVIMTAALMFRCANFRIGLAYFNDMLINMILMHVMQMTIM
jgi:hypothetical protein